MSPGASSAQTNTRGGRKQTAVEPPHKRLTDGQTDGRADGRASGPARGRPPAKRHRQRTVFEEEAAELPDGLTARLDGRQEFLAPTDDVIAGPR